MKRRYTAALLALALALALLPVSGAGEANSVGSMESITGESIIDTSERAITVTPKVLQWSEANKDIGRDVPSWWVGVNIVSPPMTHGDAKATKYKRNGGEDISFDGKWDSPKEPPAEATEYRMGAWGSLNPLFISYDYLQKQESIDYTWSFRWKGTEPAVDYTLHIVPSAVTLKKGDIESYPSNCAMEAGNGPIQTVATKRGEANDELRVAPESVKSTDTEIKVKAIAPAYVDAHWITYAPGGNWPVNGEGIAYQTGQENDGWSEPQIANLTNKEIKKPDAGTDERYYIGFTVPLNIENGEIENKNTPRRWRVDWDKDYQIAKDTDFNGFEQTYILDLSDTKVTYQVSFDLNGGTSTALASQDVNSGEKVSKPADPTRDDYTFDGWFQDREGTTAWDFDTDTVTEVMTLYAKWTPKTTGPTDPENPVTYKVTFHMNGAEAAAPEQQSVKSGGKVNKPADPARAGYTFAGWFREAACTTAWNFDADTVTADTTLYAKWTPASPGGTTEDPAKVTLPDAVRYVPWACDLQGYGGFAGGKDFKLEDNKPSWLGIRNGRLSGVPYSTGTYTFTVGYTSKDGAARKERVKVEVLRASTSNLNDLSEENWDYRITDPTEEVYGYNGGCYLTSRGDYDDFRAVYLDGDQLDEGTDYDAWRGSTVVEIYPRALRRAGYGSHTVALAFQDDDGALHCVAQNFTIKRSGSSDDDDDDRSPRVTINNRRGGTVRTYSDGEISIKVNSGYLLGEVTVNGKSVSVPSNGRLTGLRARDRVEVTFEPDTTGTMSAASINIWAPPGGTASPSNGGTWLGFRDVSPDAYYYSAVQWAVNSGVTKGKGNRTFQPGGTCTRADMVTFLWRAAGSPEPSGSGKGFTDVPSGAYYAKAVQWASAKGLVKGAGKRQFQPNSLVTRGEAVTFLYRAAGSPAASTAARFEDVRAGAYYLKPVNWAAGSGIADGVSSTHFRPERPCTRAEVMTFLYRRYQ